MLRTTFRLLGMTILLTTLLASAARAAEGYWRFEGYDLSPKQEQLDETARGTPPGRVWEARVTGAFQAEYAGKGTIELFFKYDDVDHHVFTTNVTYSFGSSQQMSVLVPGEKVVVTGAASIDGSDPGSSASGTVWVNDGDNLLSLETPVRQQKSAEGSFVVPGGGPNDTLRVSATGGLYGAEGALHETITVFYSWVEGPPPPPTDESSSQESSSQSQTSSQPEDHGDRVPGGDILGPAIQLSEPQGWSGTWTRRPGTDIFDARWSNPDGSVVTDVIRIVSVIDRSVVLTRDGNGGVYFGTVSADGATVTGTASWYATGESWSGVIGTDTDTPFQTPDSSVDVSLIPDTTGPSEEDETSTPVQSTMFVDNWNGDPCKLTDSAVLTASGPIHLDRFELWIKWPAGRSSLRYKVTFGGEEIGGGTLSRGECDPHQTDWCVGSDDANVDLVEGDYDISIDRKAICQNEASDHMGFIRAWGQ